MDRVSFQQTLQQAEAYYRAGQWREAGALALALCRAVPDQPQALCLLAMCSYQAEQFAQAAQCFERLVALVPKEARHHYLLGMSRAAAGDLAAAETSLRRALELNPTLEPAGLRLATVLISSGRHQAAIDLLTSMIQRKPGALAAQGLLAEAWVELGDLARAESVYRRLLSADSANEQGLAGLARVYLRRNLPEQARDLLAPWLQSPPALTPQSQLVLAEVLDKSGRPAEAIERLDTLLQTPSLAAADKALCLFALGRLLDKQGDFHRAFAVYQQANQATGIRYNKEASHRFFHRLHQSLASAADRPAADGDAPWPRLIFIVGIPRSGTSLTEQILASHPAVAGAGETQGVSHMLAYIDRLGLRYPEDVAALNGQQLADLRAIYLAQLPEIKGDQVHYVTDKMPDNFKHLALLRRVFPGVKIIQVKRNRLDTCLSCYFQHFSGVHDYAYDLASLADYYDLYEKWMAAWLAQDGQGTYVLNYEDLVGHFEQTLAGLLEYCGLPWDDVCRNFHRSGRAVATASYDQATRPLYSDSIGRWRHYQEHLGVLRRPHP